MGQEVLDPLIKLLLAVLVLEVLEVLLPVGQLFLVPRVVGLVLLQRVARNDVRHKLLGHMLHQEIVQVRHAVRRALLLPWSARRWLALVRRVLLLLAVGDRLVGTGRLALVLLLQICRSVTRL